QNILATLQPAPSEKQSPATACFQQAEPNDVILPDSRKLAGAALKRNQNGLLLQGSIARAPIPETFDWLRFAADFPAHLAAALSAQPEEIAFPDFPPEAQTALTDQFSSPAWNRRR